VIGSAYYLEDGVEENNLFDGNLAAFVHIIKPRSYREYGVGQTADVVSTSSDRIVPTDITAAGFYCTNANNRWKNNAASGGFVGFLFPALPHALGKSYASHRSSKPETSPLQEFDGNTAHSSGKCWSNGACIYVGGRLRMRSPETNVNDYVYDYGRTNTPDRGGNMRKGGMVFKNTKLFLCNIGLQFWGAAGGVQKPYLTLTGYQAYDTPMGAARMLGATAITDAVIVANTGNTGNLLKLPREQRLPAVSSQIRSRGLIMYDTAAQMVVTNVTFRNFYQHSTKSRDACIMDLTHSNQFVPGNLLSTKLLTFRNVAANSRLYHHKRGGCPGSQAGTCPKSCHGCEGSSLASLLANVLDEDGTLTAFGGGGIVGAADSAADTAGRSNEWWHLDDTCTQNDLNKDVAFGGFWACPRTPTTGNQKREIVSITLSQGPGKPKGTYGPAALPGTMHHFGRASRKIQVGLGGNYQVTGSCCDIGWYFASSEPLPQVFSIGLKQMVSNVKGGLVIAFTLPPDAKPVVKKFMGKAYRVLHQAQTRSEFLSDASVWPSTYLEEDTLFLRLVNERTFYYQYGQGAKLLTNTFPSNQVYVVEHRGTEKGLMKLPGINWVSR